MVITLGNFSSVNGRTVLSGLSGSGLDVSGLTESLAEARRLPAVALEDSIELNTNKTAALGELRGILSNLKDAANFLRNPPGVQNDADNVFRFRSASLTSSTSVAASTYLSVAAEPGASVQNYTISEISSLARVTKQRTGTIEVANADTSIVTSSATPGAFKAGTVTINGADITLEAGDTLNNVASKFNEVRATTGIEASIIQSGTGTYNLSFTATSSGTAAAFDLNDPGTVTADPDNVLGYLSSTNLVTNGTFDNDISGFTDVSIGTGSIAYNSGALELDGDGAGGNEAFAQQALTTEIGKTYTVTFDAAGLNSSAFARVGTDGDVSLAANSDLADFEILADGTASFTFTATSTTSYLTLNSDTNSDPITIDNLTVVDNTATSPVSTTQTATDASFVIDGITVTRSTNTIADVIDGLTFSLLQETPALTSVDVDIAADESLPLSGVTNFISAFNDLRTFVVEQSATNEDGTYNEEAYLAGENLLRSITSTLATELSATVSAAGTYSSLGEIGVTFADLPESADSPAINNILNIDSQAFASALATDFDSVEDLFGFSFTTDNANVAVFDSTNSVTASSFTLTIDPNTNTFNATVGSETIALRATALGASGYRLEGPAGSALDGLSLVYASTSAGTANVTVSQGIADRIYNAVDNVLDDQDGQLKLELDALVDSSDRYQDRIDRIDEQVQQYREQLISQFSALESTLASLNTLLQSIETNQDFLTSG